MIEQVNDVLSGAFTMGCAAVAAFFHRYFRRSGERLFGIFAVAFLLLGVERGVLAFVATSAEGRHWFFAARLIAFVLIIVAIAQKNWTGARRGER